MANEKGKEFSLLWYRNREDEFSFERKKIQKIEKIIDESVLACTPTILCRELAEVQSENICTYPT